MAQKEHIKQVRSTERQASVRVRRLQDGALRLLGLGGLRPGVEDSTDGLVENTFQVPLGEGRALEVLVSLDVLGALQRLVVRYRLHSLLSEAVKRLLVFPKIELSADKYDRDVGCMVVDLWEPLGPDVVKGWRADNGEADEEDVCLRVGERSQSVVIFLSSGIPQSQADWLSINHHTRRVVVKDCGDVFAGEGIRRVGNEQTCLADSTITCHDALQRLNPRCSHVVLRDALGSATMCRG